MRRQHVRVASVVFEVLLPDDAWLPGASDPFGVDLPRARIYPVGSTGRSDQA
jgi:hypothetical protein